MHYTHKSTRYTLLIPALALTLSACGDDIQATTEGSSSSSGTTDVDPSNPSNPSTPGTSETDTDEPPPTTTETPTSTDTLPTTVTDTDPITTETDGVTETDPTNNTTTTGTTDGTTTGSTGDTDTTASTTVDTTGSTSDTDTSTGGVIKELSGVWATSNPGALVSDALVSLDLGLAAQVAKLSVLGDVVSIQSIGVNNGGDGIITYDAPGGAGGVIIRLDLSVNPVNGPLGVGDRVITGPTTGLVAPKGVEALGPSGTFVIADTGAKDIKVFDNDDKGDVAPLFVITDLGSSEAVWDVHYVGNADTLYAAGTNGEVQVYEDFKDSMGQAGPDRTIVPTFTTATVSINLHGITVDSNNLYLSDVGDPMLATDGQLFIIANANAADGNIAVKQRIQGGSLGNPVDLELRPGNPGNLYVAEKLNDKVLVYTRNLMTDQFEFNKDFALNKPESVAIVAGSGLIVASNPADLDSDAAVAIAAPLLGDLSLTATIGPPGSITSVQSVSLADSGDGFVSFDGPAISGGGVFVVDGLAEVNADGTASSTAGRIWGKQTQLFAPRGLSFSESQDRLFVADFGAKNVKVFDPAALGDTAPLFTISELDDVAPWDVHYDDVSDILFVASVDGKLRVYDQVLVNQGAGGPSRTITPVDGADVVIGVNLHGVHYDAASKKIVLSDVGDPLSAADGAIFVIADADTADGLVPVQAVIRGAMTQLGNPVDVVFDGANLYVAEKANSFVFRYDGILELVGEVDAPADGAIAVANAESVTLAFTAP